MQQYTQGLVGSLQYVISHALELGEWAEHLNWGERLQTEENIQEPEIVGAFKAIRRYDFMPDNIKAQNGVDAPLPIGHGQTISQPSAVGSMLEWLQPHRGQRILDFGSGSGWSTALLGKTVGGSGLTIGLERIPELVEFGQTNIANYTLPSTEIRQAGEELGLPDEDPFDRILVSAHLPQGWLEKLQQQLSPHCGRLVAPLIADENYGSNAFVCDLVTVSRHGQKFQTDTLAKGYGFVPTIYEADDQFSVEQTN